MTAAAAPSRGALLAAFASIYFIWGSTFLAIRFAIETIPPFLMAGARFTAAGAVLFAWLLLRGEGPPPARAWAPAALAGGSMLLGGNGGVVWAEQHVPSGIVALVIATIPLWMVILDWAVFGGSRPGGPVVGGLIAGFAGVALLVDPNHADAGGRVDPVSALVLTCTSASWAFGSLYTRRARVAASPLMATAMQLLAGGAFLLAAGAATGEAAAFDPAGVSARSLLSLAYLSLLGSVVTYSAYIWLLRVAQPAHVATYAYVNPVVAVALGSTWGAEPIGARSLLATGIIVAAVVWIGRARPAARADPGSEAATLTPPPARST